MSTDYLRVEQALHYIEEHVRDQPSLREIAEHFSLSPFHFQRVFKRWAGVSPKRFLQFLTIDYAKELLNNNQNILDVTYESGFPALADSTTSLSRLTLSRRGNSKPRALGSRSGTESIPVLSANACWRLRREAFAL